MGVRLCVLIEIWSQVRRSRERVDSRRSRSRLLLLGEGEDEEVRWSKVERETEHQMPKGYGFITRS